MPKNIPQLLDALKTGTIEPELYEIILSISKQKVNTQRASTGGSTGNKQNNPEDCVIDFIFYLKDNIGIGDITTKNHLYREFNRFITKSNASENHELWAILSYALIYLEKNKKVFRNSKKKFSNSNDTIWYLKEFKDTEPNISENNEKIKQIPVFTPVKRKANSKNQAKVIPPGKARELIIYILEAVGGPVDMRTIFQIASSKVVLSSLKELPQQNNTSEGEEVDIVSNVKSEETEALLFALDEEVENRVLLIWQEVEKIERGISTKIQGTKILCLYILPSKMGEKKIKLSDFGPKSTVDDVSKDVMSVLRKYLSFSDSVKSDMMFPVQNIIINIIQKINEKCSETYSKADL